MLIVSQSRENDKMKAVAELVESLGELVSKAVEGGSAAHEMERQLWSGVLGMGHQLLELYFELLGPGDEGEEVYRDGQRLKRSSELEPRKYLSVFGPVEIRRWTYSRGAKQRVDYAPLDEHAGLPKKQYSYLLQDRSQHLATELSYQGTQGMLERFLGFRGISRTPIKWLPNFGRPQVVRSLLHLRQLFPQPRQLFLLGVDLLLLARQQRTQRPEFVHHSLPLL